MAPPKAGEVRVKVIASALCHKDIYTLQDLIDKQRYYKPNYSHLEYTEENKQHCSPDDHHPSADGHRDWAQQLKDFIDANNLLTV